jgi:hypothetical protein
LHITHAAHLTGQFNAHLWTCLYVFADEAFWAGDKQGEAVLKGLITERPMMVTKKGVDSVPGVNRVKTGIASNSDWVVPASEDERRFAVTDSDNRYARGEAPEEERKQYFGPIYRELAEGGAAAMPNHRRLNAPEERKATGQLPMARSTPSVRHVASEYGPAAQSYCH